MPNPNWGIFYYGNHIRFGSELVLLPFGQVYIVTNIAAEEENVTVFDSFNNAIDYCVSSLSETEDFIDIIKKGYFNYNGE